MSPPSGIPAASPIFRADKASPIFRADKANSVHGPSQVKEKNPSEVGRNNQQKNNPTNLPRRTTGSSPSVGAAIYLAAQIYYDSPDLSCPSAPMDDGERTQSRKVDVKHNTRQ